MKKTVIFFLLLLSFHLFSDEDEKQKLAVMEFEDLSGKLSKDMLSRATELIRSKFVASNKFIVIAKERQEKAIIKEMKKESYKACNDKNCQIPLGQALSADTILRTTINFFGGTYTITSELIDLEKEATVQGAEAVFNGNENSLNTALNDIVRQIIGTKKQSENSGSSQDKRACEYAKKEENLETWEMYLKKFPDGECAFEAESKIGKLKKKEDGAKQSEKIKLELKPIQPVKINKIGQKRELVWSRTVLRERGENAAKACKNLREDGFSDWRLPTIDELRTLVQNCPATESGGECGLSVKCSGKGCFDGKCIFGCKDSAPHSRLSDRGYLWSSTAFDKEFTWGIDFGTAKIEFVNKFMYAGARCVR